MVNCPYCRVVLPWPTSQQRNYGHNPQQPNPKKTNPFLIIALVSLGFTVICLLALVVTEPPTDKNWFAVPLLGVIVFLGIFVISTIVLLIKHIINKIQTKPWRLGFILLILVASLVILVSIFSAIKTSHIYTIPPVTSPTPPVTSPTPPPTTTPSNPTPPTKPEPMRHDVSLGEIVNNPAYWNMAWQEKTGELQVVCRRVNQQYLKTHTYIKGETDCNDMAIDIWNMLQTEGIVSILVTGNIDIPNPTFAQCNHTWLVILGFEKGYSKPKYFFLEPTNGEVYFYEDRERNPQLKFYEWGYFYIKPSDLKEDFKERW